MQYDVVVIGGGPGGYVAAIYAAQKKLKVALVEKKHLGGVCLNWGCIPTKALLRSAEAKHLIDNASKFGIDVDKAIVNLDNMVQRSREIANQLSRGISGLMKKNKIDVFMGTGKISGKGQLDVTSEDGKTQKLTAKDIVLATGARSRRLPGVAEHPRVWVAADAMLPTFMPKKLLVIGSGAIGMEFASFYQTLGTEVTVAEIQEHILPVEDAEISKTAQKLFTKQGMRILTKASVSGIKPNDKSVDVTLNDKAESFDAVLMAVGIEGNVENIGLENTHVVVEKGHIVTHGSGRTDEAHVYAIGDVTGPPWLAHKASHEGISCIDAILGVNRHPPKYIPGCTYTLPGIASVGLTEKAADEKGHKIKVGRFPLQANGKALAMGEPDGFVKLIFDETTGALLGAHMIGHEVTEMIHSMTLALNMEATEEDLHHTVFPHPTLSEAIHESSLDAFGGVIHM